MIDFACKRFELAAVLKCALGLSKGSLRIFQELATKKSWLTAKKISDLVVLDESSVQRCLKVLYEKKLVQRRQSNRTNGGYVFMYHVSDSESIKQLVRSIITQWTQRVNVELDEKFT